MKISNIYDDFGGPDSFPGNDEDSHYMSQTSATKIKEGSNTITRVSPHSVLVGEENPTKTNFEVAKKSAWIQTYSGKKFYPLEPNAEYIDIEDIAHSLSMLCRFTGHVQQFYSVGDHSINVSYACDPKYALYGLLHDASEAYLQDLPSPLKNSGEFENYKKYESVLQTMIYNKFGLFEPEPPTVKKADMQMLATEARDLMGHIHPEWVQKIEPLSSKINPLDPKTAKEKFLKRFKELYEK